MVRRAEREDLKKYVAAARKTRKAGGQPKRPTGLPPLTPEQSERYGFTVAAEKDAATEDTPADIEPAAEDHCGSRGPGAWA